MPLLITGVNGFICSDCAQQAYRIVKDSLPVEHKEKDDLGFDLAELPKPRDIKAYLDQYVIGQDDAKRNLAVAVYNHYKRLAQQTSDDGVEIEKSNIIMVGSTGTGKTLLARTIAKLLHVPFTIVDATVFTEAGYVGEDVESILSRLLQVADYNVQAAQRGIVFIDEIDKLASGSQQRSADISREGVQRDLLPIVEGSAVNTKYGLVNTDHILFIAAGAFHLSKPSDLFPELQGRFPLRAELEALGKEEFYRILTEPHNSLTRQYEAMLETEGVRIEFTDDGLREIAAFAEDVNTRTENIGARRLHTIMEKILADISFDASEKGGSTLVIDREHVVAQLADVRADAELSRFIL